MSKPKFTAKVRRGLEFVHEAGENKLADHPPKKAADRADVQAALDWMKANFEPGSFEPGHEKT